MGTASAPELLVVSGLSGSGKSTALNALEDLGYFCVDNLPVELLGRFAEYLDSGLRNYPRAAVGLDARSPDATRLAELLDSLRGEHWDFRLIFLTADEDSLLRRFGATRRKHPLDDGGGLAAALAAERELLHPLNVQADVVIDSTECNVHQLRQRVWQAVEAESESPHLLFKSFGFSRGTPGDLDFLFDARCLANPHWQPQLRPLTGLDPEIRDYLDNTTLGPAYVERITEFLLALLPEFATGPKNYLTVGIGCTGGRHRSVYTAQRLSEAFAEKGHSTSCNHRDIDAK